ncbi:hypothetical protein L914_02756 [Phytophthora nicotianae]|uniref:Uncharacterized protein n=1 Tax=Phytophthora nicotianae TaxID=4792 RepID=W2NZ31_PHYNI|nr:hypothetical protein L914_02756 [Phytophthora nicotianae]
MVVAKTLEALLEPDLEPEAELIAMMTSVAFLAPRTTSRASPETSKAVLESVQFLRQERQVYVQDQYM